MVGSVAAAVVVFDFDRTIIDDDSDRWIVAEMGLTHLFNQLRQTMPWTSLMDRIMEELHSNGITTDHIAECLKRVPLHAPVVSAIKSARALGCDLRIISDANLFSIRTILEHHGLLGCFSQINTNPAFVDKEGRLRITPFHDSTLSPHPCPLCPSNMCKGLVIDQIRGSLAENERIFIYIGDGTGDYCPTLKLKGGDFVMPRKNYPLWNRIHSDPKLVAAEVHDWSSGEELENILLNLINKLATPPQMVKDTHSFPCRLPML
ncbi:Inorganic pyrophosphatase 3 [Spatholobus suberectus]|nr:Inorganic pyrophosphatase 3 [Spatholobus suberectus]